MDKVSIGRVYDGYMRGGHTFGADREFMAKGRAILPDVENLGAAARCFVKRAVKYCLRDGALPVLDLGAGIESVWTTYHMVHALDPRCPVVCVDNEAVAVESLLAATRDNPKVGVVRGDARDPEVVVAAAERQGLDRSQPLLIIMTLLCHFIPDSDAPADLLAQYRQIVAPGSYVIFSHDTADGREEDMRKFEALYATTNRPLILRDRATIAKMFGGYRLSRLPKALSVTRAGCDGGSGDCAGDRRKASPELRTVLLSSCLVEPGIVHTPLWRPHPDDPVVDPPESSCVYALVAQT